VSILRSLDEGFFRSRALKAEDFLTAENILSMESKHAQATKCRYGVRRVS